jgi:hypothetical protein
VVFFGRFVSVLRTYAAFLAGTMRMPWWRFFAFNAAGGILWALMYGLGAYLLGQELNRLTRTADLGGDRRRGSRRRGLPALPRPQRRLLEEEAERALPGPLQPQ